MPFRRGRIGRFPDVHSTSRFYLARSDGISYNSFMNTTTLLTNSIQRPFGRAAVLLVSLLIICSGPVREARAVSPPPDGGYSGGNTAEGQAALLSLSTGSYNTAVGVYSLLSLSDASFNTGVGAGTLLANTAGENTATGAGALLGNTTGATNTANGAFALLSNVGGSSNTAIGDRALQDNVTGNGHTAVGFQALQHSIVSFATGSGTAPDGFGPNTAVGNQALFTNTIGNGNTAIGAGALFNNDMGGGNTAIGLTAGSNITGILNICIGAAVSGVAGESNTVRIGDNLSDTQGNSACYIGGIYNQMIDVGSAAIVGIDNTGKLGTVASSRRFKQDIKPMDKVSEAILRLKPVAFRYKHDAKNTPCFGLIAEEVAAVNPDLVVRNKNGEIWTVRYDQINAMLLNEFLKEHRKVEEQEATITQLKKDFGATVAQLTARLDQQASQIQNVGAQLAAASLSDGGLEASKPVPKVVNNP
jgi:hypothetical protein